MFDVFQWIKKSTEINMVIFDLIIKKDVDSQ